MESVFRRRDLCAPERRELLWGIFCWVAYLIGIPLLLDLALPRLDIDFATPRGNALFSVCVYALTILVVVPVFRKFLWRSAQTLRGSGFLLLTTALWGFLSCQMLVSVLAYLSYALDLIPENLNNAAVETLLREDTTPMLICTVLLAPVLEECLIRGMLFAPLCRYRPWLGYVVSVFFFAFLHVAAYLGRQDIRLLLLSFLQYLPAGLVLGWAYQRTRSIFAPILLHALLNLYASIGLLS